MAENIEVNDGEEEVDVDLTYAQTADALASAELNSIEVERNRLAWNEEKAGDFVNGFLAFNVPVQGGTVAQAMHYLRRCHRVDPGRALTIELNTPGGSIVDGLALVDEIEYMKTLGHDITIRVRGEAASMGAVVLQAGTRRQCGRNSWIMLHKAAFGADGKTYEVEDELKLAKRMEDQIYRIFGERSGKSPAYWKRKLNTRKDYWLTAEEALAEGLIDEIV